MSKCIIVPLNNSTEQFYEFNNIPFFLEDPVNNSVKSPLLVYKNRRKDKEGVALSHATPTYYIYPILLIATLNLPQKHCLPCGTLPSLQEVTSFVISFLSNFPLQAVNVDRMSPAK